MARFDITPKVVKVTAEIDLYVGDTCVGTTTVDITPTPQAVTTGPIYNMSGQDNPAVRGPIDHDLQRHIATHP